MDGPPDMASPAAKRKAISGDEKSRHEERTEDLIVEEKRTKQMKTLIQKLLMSSSNGCLNIDDKDLAKRTKEMFVKCGEDIAILRNDG